ncbi:MAG: tRNA pseudouridine(38-40) synthase TruA [Ruminococcaceae bacterium]|nr:tRNA pseudouridine(38-40) synthase TruA [Oscillospiraceae bacterium]
MKNYKITVQYDGTRYNGWQRQGNTQNTIQERFENVLSKMCGKNIEVFASGRTDAGVHAEAQTANFKCDTELSAEEIKEYLNQYLPQDILVTSVTEADERFHSRLNAVSKTYEYKIATRKPDVFIRKFVYFADDVPNVEKMRLSAKQIVGTHDFKGFSSVGKTKKSTVRTINYIEIFEEDGIITIRINGSGFLYNMVRIISGTLYEIGTGKLDERVISEVFETKCREAAGTTLPACGLKLIEVFYQ